ncbi:hypothetical protein T492DRAFT_893570 [Pavlovales sp. CCMP2436]|nr:hypothetical protein T492DRAFT_893570 [Pavlovales sp. CCMP2436]
MASGEGGFPEWQAQFQSRPGDLSGGVTSIDDLWMRALENRIANPTFALKCLGCILEENPSHEFAETMHKELVRERLLRRIVNDEQRGPLAVLGLQPGASVADIRKAFKALALQVHSDKTGGFPDIAFIIVNEARRIALADIADTSGAAAGP